MISITTGLAIWGAVLSTVLAVWELLKYRKRLPVETRYTEDGDGGRYISLQVSNAGIRPVTIDQPYLRMSNGKSIVATGPQPQA